MTTPLLTFNAKSVPCDVLEKTLIGRKEIVDRVFSNLRDRVLTGSNYQSLIVAPRGSGKTHMTKVLYCRIKENKDLRPKVLIAYMIEDEAGIGSFMHLILHILDAMYRYGEPESENIPAIKDEISKLAYNQQEQAFVDALLVLLGERKLVLLIENFDTILNQMGKEGARLRDFMHNHDRISILATAQLLTSQLNKAEYPFYQFFDTRNLQKLSFDEMIDLVEALVEIEEDEAIKKNMGAALADPKQDLKAKLRAIYDLTMGNHRLTVHFYSFLKADLKADLSTVFIKQMNGLKTYYEQFIKQLSTQQQRIVQVLSLSRIPLTPKSISEKAFLPTNSVTKQLGELSKLGYLDGHKVGRNTLYEIDEPLMRICFEINENPDGIAALFIDFLKVVYDRKFLTRQYLFFQYGSRFNPEMEKRYEKEATMYKLALGELYLDELAYSALGSVISEPEMRKVASELSEKEVLMKKILELGTDNLVNLLSELELNFETVRNDAELLLLLGSIYGDLGRYKEAHTAFKESIKIDPNNFMAYYGMGSILLKMGNYELAISNLKKSASFNSKIPMTFYLLAKAYKALGKFSEACIYSRKALDLKPTHLESLLLLVDLNYILDNDKELESAIIYLSKAKELLPHNYNIVNELGRLHFRLLNIQESKDLFQLALKINPTFDESLKNLSLVLGYQGEYKKSIENIQEAIAISPNKVIYKLILINMLIVSNNSEKAFDVWSNCKNENIHDIDKSYYKRLLITLLSLPENVNTYTFKIIKEIAELGIKNIDHIWTETILHGFSRIDKSKKHDLINLHRSFTNYFKDSNILPLTRKYFDIGIRYLIMSDKMSIYNLSKEERNVFFKYIDQEKKM